MPVGIGDLPDNVWTAPNGGPVLLVSTADAWSELNNPLKLGRFRIRSNVSSGADPTEVVRQFLDRTAASERICPCIAPLCGKRALTFYCASRIP